MPRGGKVPPVKTVPVQRSPQVTDALKRAFEFIDTDGSGTISVSELEALLKSKGSDVDSDDVTRIMAQMENDGETEIDLDEFMMVGAH